MNHQAGILVGIFNGFSWIRSEGKGSFANSPVVKAFGESRIEDGETCIVVDLGGCPAMDSTFMGTLAGMAKAMKSGVVQVADAGDRNQSSLQDLGLDYFIEINPSEAVWQNSLETIRGELQLPPNPGEPGELQRAEICLDAHRNLSAISDDNEEKFRSVVDLMEKEVEASEAASFN